MTSLDGALQLLLIIDHIFDWARDIYRPAILRHLRFLSEPDDGDAMSITHDSDIFSMQRPKPSSIGSQVGFEDITLDSGGTGETSDDLNPLRLLDSTKGVLRDAALVEYSFISITITGDNARTILRSFPPAPAIKLARKLLSSICFHDGVVKMDGETLSAVETLWTGDLQPTNLITSKREFYTRLTYKTYLTDDWVIMKELLCLAISEEAVAVLLESSKQTKNPETYAVKVDKGRILNLYSPFRHCSSDYNLRAAVCRLALSLYLTTSLCATKNFCETHIDHKWQATPGLERKRLIGARFGLIEEMEGDPTHSIIDDIYRKHKIGRREPVETYIRMSANTENQIVDSPGSPDPYPALGNEHLCREGGHVIVVGSCLHRSLWSNNSPEVCLFIRSRGKHQDKNLAALRSLIGKVLERDLAFNRDIFSTHRYLPSQPLSAVKWNIKDTVSIGMGQHQPKIRAWLCRLRDEHGVDTFLRKTDVGCPLEENEKVSQLEEELADGVCSQTSDHDNQMGGGDPETDFKQSSPQRYRVQILGEWVDQ